MKNTTTKSFAGEAVQSIENLLRVNAAENWMPITTELLLRKVLASAERINRKEQGLPCFTHTEEAKAAIGIAKAEWFAEQRNK